jgi:transcriptional regulator with XRE-family HTH domain
VPECAQTIRNWITGTDRLSLVLPARVGFQFSGVIGSIVGVTMTEPHRPGCARSIRSGGLAGGQTVQQIIETIHHHCGVTLLRAHRLAYDWTLEHVVAELRSICLGAWGTDPPLSHQYVSRWENGADLPSPKYLDALCRLYRTRPDRLGFGHDYSTGSAEPDGTRMRPADGQHFLVASGVTAVPATLTSALREARTGADALLETQSVSAATVDWWEALVREYGCLQNTVPHLGFLSEAVPDFAVLCRTLSSRQPLEFQNRLYRVMAQLAGLIGFDVMGTGALRESREWFHTARLAADETGDRQLRAWVMASGSMTYFWDSALTERAVELCQTAQAIAGPAPTVAGTLAASIQGRACARLGHRSEARAALHRAEAMFERLDPAETHASRLGLGERCLRFHQENVLTWLGETDAALATQQHALKLSPDAHVESALIQLDRADCLIAGDELDEGCRVAGEAVLQVHPDSRGGVVVLRAREIELRAASHGDRLGPVRDLRETLGTASGNLGHAVGREAV